MLPDAPRGPGSILVGRDREVRALDTLLAATAGGSGGCAVLTGVPGIGKTRLLREAHRRARAQGLAVAPGTAIELDRAEPLRSLASALGAAEPEGFDLSGLRVPAGDRLWYVDRLGDALESYVARRPLVVLLDDAHWCDELSALALRVLVPRLSSSPVRWFLARRPVPPSPGQDAIDWLVAQGADETLVPPLEMPAVRALCGAVLGAAPDASVLAIAAGGQGNPFLLVQYLTALQTTGQVLVRDGVASVVGGDLPSSFLSAVEQRLRGLSAQALRLLQAASIFGRPFTLHEAAALSGVRVAALVPAAEEVVHGGLLVAHGTWLAFAHDLLRQAVYDNLSGPARAAMHREAAQVVRDEGSSPVEVAAHLVRAGHRADRGVVDVLRAAAEEVATRAPSTAADILTHALGVLPPDAPERQALSATAVRLLASAGRVAQALELGESTLRGELDVATRATVLHGLAEALKHEGRNRAAAEYARRALAEPDVPDDLRAQLHASEAHALLYADDLPGADKAGAEAERLGTAVDEPGATVYALAARSVVASTEGRFTDALGYASRAVELCDRSGGATLHRHPRIWLGAALAALDRFDEAEEAYSTGRRRAERLGTGWSLPLFHYYNASLLLIRGRLDDAAADAEAGVRIGEQLTAVGLCVPLLGLLARIAVHRDEVPAAHEYLQRMNRLRGDGLTAAPEDVAWPIARVQYADGQPGAALSTVDQLTGRLLLFSYDAGTGAELVRIALAAGDRARARAAAATARLLAERNPRVTSLAAIAAHAHGLAYDDLAALHRAVELFAGSPRPLARAAALEDTGRAELECGNRARAVELLNRAVEDVTMCGARRAERRLTCLLGIAPAPSGGDGSALSTLTAAELGIAKLVAQGLTNQQIAAAIRRSPHTVDSHLRKIFQKLGVSSRAAVAGIVSQTGNP